MLNTVLSFDAVKYIHVLCIKKPCTNPVHQVSQFLPRSGLDLFLSTHVLVPFYVAFCSETLSTMRMKHY